MKKLFLSLTGILFSAIMMAQAPNAIKYQAVARDGDDKVIANQEVSLTISILQGSLSGTEVFAETHDSTTNAYGLVTLNIGAGNPTDFANIDWADGPYFVKVEMDGSLMGTSQLLSVPYAMHAKTATDPSIPTGTQAGDMQYWDGTAWVSFAAGTTGQRFTNINGIPTWIDGDAQVDPVSDQIWKDVTSPTGEIWMDRNLGATQVATSSTDADAYGDLYQWGRAADGHQSRTSDTTSTLSNTDTPGHGDFILDPDSPIDWRNPQNDNLWQGVSGINNPCPSGYRLPTEAEWEAEIATWDSEDAVGAFASPLKLPAAGRRYGSSGSLNNVGSNGYYWSSTVNGTGSVVLNFFTSNAFMLSLNRANGRSVRCIKD